MYAGDDGSEEFQTRPCDCTNCRTEGLYEYNHGHTSLDCAYARKVDRQRVATCKLCAA